MIVLNIIVREVWGAQFNYLGWGRKRRRHTGIKGGGVGVKEAQTYRNQRGEGGHDLRLEGCLWRFCWGCAAIFLKS